MECIVLQAQQQRQTPEKKKKDIAHTHTTTQQEEQFEYRNMDPPLKNTDYYMFTTLHCFVVLKVSKHSTSSTTV